MSGVYWAAVWVTAVVMLGAGVVWRVWLVRVAANMGSVLAAFLMELPLCFLVNEYVKAPIFEGIRAMAWGWSAGEPRSPWLYVALLLWVTPLTEEAAKLLPAVIPETSLSLGSRVLSLQYGMSSGLGFGLGEAWYMAWGIAHSPLQARFPFYYYASYMTTRIVMCFAHGVMTGVAMTGLGRGIRASILGYLTAAALHAFLNLGGLLYQEGLAGPSAPGFTVLVSILILVAVFERLHTQGEGELL